MHHKFVMTAGSLMLLACALLVVIITVSGCHELTLEEAKTWYEKKPQNYDEYMQAATNARSMAKYDDAADMYQKAMDDIESKYGADDLRIATAARYYASMQNERGKFADSEALYKRALDIESKALPADSADVVQIKKELAEVLLKEFKQDEANKLLSTIKSQPSKHPKKSGRHHR